MNAAAEKRVIDLAKGEWLWRQGDPAVSVGVVQSGKLGVWDETRLVGVLHHNMVLGETALLTVDGTPERRTVSVSAVEGDATVVSYAAPLVRRAIEKGEDRVADLVLRTLIGQAARNWLLVIAANEDHAFVHKLLESFAESCVEAVPRLSQIRNWEEFMLAFRLLRALRDQSESERRRLVAPEDESTEGLERAGHVMRWLFKGSDFLGELESFIAAERERIVYEP